MSFFDTNTIINGTPSKKILNAYRTMKDSYTEESAKEFYDVYTKQPLSEILINPRLIFSEAYYGTEFIKDIFSDPSSCVFEHYDSVLHDMKEFVDKNGVNMHSSQKKIYENAISAIEETKKNCKSAILYSSYIKENIDDSFEQKIRDILFEMKYNSDETKDYESIVTEMFNDVTVPEYMLYMPYVTENAEKSNYLFTDLAKYVNDFVTETVNEDPEYLKGYFDALVASKKLLTDPAYVEATGYIIPKYRSVIKAFSETSLSDIVNELPISSTYVNPESIYHVSSESAVNSIFDDIMEESLYYEDERESRNKINTQVALAYESTFDILYHEFTTCDNPEEKASGYSLLNEEISIEKAVGEVNKLHESVTGFYKENTDPEDVTDDEIDQMNQSVNSDDTGDDIGKKPVAPPANNKQIASMDKEAKAFAKKQTGRKKIGFFGKIKSVPKGVHERIQQEVNKYDEMDDKRRKEFFTQPGFRKKWFRNLKLAILYGGAATYKITMVPVVALLRHFSKQKDRRMRNELVRELETEIKVADEKINDANANGDLKEKYRLIRIKDQLTAEKNRVITNSKYI